VTRRGIVAAAEHEQLRRRCDHLDERGHAAGLDDARRPSPHARARTHDGFVDGPRERDGRTARDARADRCAVDRRGDSP